MVDYFSFEDVMRELELSEEDLKRMVSEGELRAFRDENKMKFKKDDVEHLKKGRITEPTIILPSTPGGGQDETVLDLDITHEAAQLQSAEPRGRAIPPPPPPQAEDDLLVTTPAEEVGTETDETFVEDSDTGQTTEPLRLADEIETAETVAEGEPVEEEAAPGRKGQAGRRRRAAAAAAPMAEQEMERARPHPAWTALLVASLAFALYSNVFVYDLMRLEAGRTDQPSVLTAGPAEWILGQFWGDAKWKEFHERRYPERKPPYNASVDASLYQKPSFRVPDLPKAIPQE